MERAAHDAHEMLIMRRCIVQALTTAMSYGYSAGSRPLRQGREISRAPRLSPFVCVFVSRLLPGSRDVIGLRERCIMFR